MILVIVKAPKLDQFFGVCVCVCRQELAVKTRTAQSHNHLRASAKARSEKVGGKRNDFRDKRAERSVESASRL